MINHLNYVLRENVFLYGNRLLAAVGATAFLAAAVLLKQVNPINSRFFPQCPFHALTGLNCPGCGATRGMHALLNGDVLTALHFNFSLILFVPLMIYGFAVLVSLGLRGRGLPFPHQYSAPLLTAFLTLLFVFAVLRNLPFYPFNLLAI